MIQSLRSFAVAVVLILLALIRGQGQVSQTIGDAVAVEGDHFTVKTVPTFLTFVSYFDGIRAARSDRLADPALHQKHVDDDFAWLEGKVSGVRVFGIWNNTCSATGDPETTPLFNADGNIDGWTYGDLQQVVQLAANHHLAVDLSFDNTVGPSPASSLTNYTNALKEVARKLHEDDKFVNVLIDVENEWETHNKSINVPPLKTWDHDLIKSVIAAMPRTQPPDAKSLMPLTASRSSDATTAGTEAAYENLDFTAFHDDRTMPAQPDGWLSKIPGELDHVRSGLGSKVMPIHFQEPISFDNGPSPCIPPGGQTDTNLADAQAAARSAKSNGAAGWTFHNRQSFRLRDSSLRSLLALAEITAIEGLRCAVDGGTGCQPNDGVLWGVAAFGIQNPPITVESPGGSLQINLTRLANSTGVWRASVVEPAPTWILLTRTIGTSDPNDLTVPFTVAANGGGTRTAQIDVSGRRITVTQNPPNPPPPPKTVNDYDGDGKADLAVWRAPTGTWYVLKSSLGNDVTRPISVQFGNQSLGDVPIVADMDGDGKSDLLVWRASTSAWYWVTANGNFNTAATHTLPDGGFGNQSLGDVPFVGDFDGDGLADPAVWRASTGTWYWLQSSAGYHNNAMVGHQWGNSSLGDVPFLADIDGDGKPDLIVWRASNGTWYWLTSSSGYNVGGGGIQWGNSSVQGDVPLLGDIDGDGKADLVVWRPGTGTWFWLTSSSGYSYAQAGSKQWGNNNLGDVPILEDIDGDGKSDLVLWRTYIGSGNPASWYWLPSRSGYNYPNAGTVQWGNQNLGDVPLPKIH